MENIFTSGLAWKIFKDLETAFINYIEYVPLRKEHDKVYSPKLLQLILQIGSSIDTLFKNMVACDDLDSMNSIQDLREKVERNSAGISDFRKIFNSFYELSSQEIQIRQDLHIYGSINPFEDFSLERSPYWWKAYTAVKHDWHKNIKKANLKNTVSSLAGLFLLNVIHMPNRSILVDYEVIRSGWLDSPEVRGLARGYLKACLKESPAKISKGIPTANVYAKTPVFLYIFKKQ